MSVNTVTISFSPRMRAAIEQKPIILLLLDPPSLHSAKQVDFQPQKILLQMSGVSARLYERNILVYLCAITFWRISAFWDFFYKHSRGTRLYFKPRNLNFQESRYMCGSFCSKGLCFPCCVPMCVVCLCVLCACVVCRKCWKCFLTSCGHARNPPKDSVSPLLYHSATLKRYISISFNQIDTDSALDYYGYSWQIPIQDFEQNLRSWNSETERYFNKICPVIFPPILKDWRHFGW